MLLQAIIKRPGYIPRRRGRFSFAWMRSEASSILPDDPRRVRWLSMRSGGAPDAVAWMLENVHRAAVFCGRGRVKLLRAHLGPGCWRTCAVRPSFAAVGVSGCSGRIRGPGCWQTCTVRPWMRSPGAGSRRRCAPMLPAFSRMIRAACVALDAFRRCA